MAPQQNPTILQLMENEHAVTVLMKLRVWHIPTGARIDMGVELFKACVAEGSITMETYDPVGNIGRPQQLPTYRGNNIALAAPELPAWDFQIDA